MRPADLTDELAQQLAGARALTALAGRPDEAARAADGADGAEAEDPTRTVRAGVDPVGRLLAVQIAPRWQARLPTAEDLAGAIRFAAAAAYSASQGWPAPSAADVARTWDVADLEADATAFWDAVEATPADRSAAASQVAEQQTMIERATARPPDEVVDEVRDQLARLSDVVAGLTAPATLDLANPAGTVALSFLPSGVLTAVTIDPQWAAARSGTAVMTEIHQLIAERDQAPNESGDRL